MDYSYVVAVTNRHLCVNDYYDQLKRIASLGVKTIIIREKDLTKEGYEDLFQNCVHACEGFDVKIVPHTYWKVAKKYDAKRIHLSLNMFETLSLEDDFLHWSKDVTIGTSIHSVEELKKAKKLQAAYVTAGHIFATDCKKGLEPRGLKFLEDICKLADMPVYGIGGITCENYEDVILAGANKVCMMSEMMRA